jgi:hypothetical protein
MSLQTVIQHFKVKFKKKNPLTYVDILWTDGNADTFDILLTVYHYVSQ